MKPSKECIPELKKRNIFENILENIHFRSILLFNLNLNGRNWELRLIGKFQKTIFYTRDNESKYTISRLLLLMLKYLLTSCTRLS